MSEMPNEQNSPAISEILRKVDADIAAGKPIDGGGVALPDPSPSPMAVHREKLQSTINTACAVAMETTRLAIEREHAVMRALTARRDQVHEAIEDYLQLIQAVNDHGHVVQEAFTELERQFVSPVLIEPEPAAGKPTKANGGKR